MAAPKPSFVPRQSSGHDSAYKTYDEKRPPAATFEPERWSKAYRVKDGKEVKGSAVYSWSRKPETFAEQTKGAGKMLLSGLTGLLPKKKVGEVKRWGGGNKRETLREGDRTGPGDIVHHKDGRVTEETRSEEKPFKQFPVTSGAADFRKKVR